MKNLLEFTEKNNKILFGIGILILIVHIVLFQSINSVFLAPPILYWILLGIIYRLNEKYFFGIALCFLIFSVPPLLIGKLDLAEKFSVWEYLFLVLGLFQWFIFDIFLPMRKKYKVF